MNDATVRHDQDGGVAVVWHAEMAISRKTGTTTWLVVDEEFDPHPEVQDFAVYLSQRSPETQRAYMPRIARFLNWCETNGVDWRMVSLRDLTRFKSEVESTPIPKKGTMPTGKTVNAVLTAVCQYLRFCAGNGLIDMNVLKHLSEPRLMRYVPSGYNPGEGGQHLLVKARTLKAPEIEHAPETINDEVEQAVLGACSTVRDKLLICVMIDGGLRIGEVLGLRREDVHPLPDSSRLGCSVRGPHIHVRPRPNNPNGARVKSGRARTVPITPRCVTLHADYLVIRGDIAQAQANDFVFVNQVGATVGEPMTYSNAKQIIERVGVRVRARVRPHMLRHTAATRWVRSGVALDVVQELLGHASSSSTLVYVHASDDDKREAVERVGGERTA